MSKRRLAARLGALPLAAAFGLLAAAPASAHVTISPEEGTAGAYTVLTVSVPHGCEGSPTTKVAIQMPEQILSVTPTRHPMWEVEKVMTQLDQPVTDAHGNKVTERVGQVVYTTDTPLPEGYRDAFELSLQLPDTPGETLVFPTIQTCKQGETAWVQVAEDGNTEELDAPAPTVTVLPAEPEAADEEASSETGESAQETSAETTPVAAEAREDGGSNLWGITGLVAGLLGLVAGVAALVMVRKRA